MIQSLLKVGWVGLGCPFPGACRIPKNSSQFPTRPLSLYCPKLVTLYYVTFYEMEQLCRSTSYRKFTLNPWRKKLLFVKLFSTFTFIKSSAFAQLPKVLREPQKLFGNSVRDKPFQCNSARMKFLSNWIWGNILNLRIVFSNIVVNFSSQICFDPSLLTIDCSWSQLLHSTNCCGSGARDADGQETGSNNRPVFFSWIPAFS